MAVALRAHLLLPDRGGAHTPDRRGIGIRSEDCDLARPERAAQRLVGGEPREPGADHRDASHYFTEPASSPWTK